ncbi:MAG: DUF4386 domain-containing protein [Ilumatobacteraceae bacterium]
MSPLVPHEPIAAGRLPTPITPTHDHHRHHDPQQDTTMSTRRTPDRTITPTPELDRQRAAWLAGLAYAALFVLAIFANFAVRERVIDVDDATGTMANVVADEQLTRVAMLAFLVIFVLDIAVSWLLHLVFRPTGERRSLLAAWFRIGYTVFLGMGLVFMFVGLRLADGGEFVGSLGDDDRASQALLAFDAFNATWMVGLTLFGLHLVVLARIIWTSGIGPKWLGATVGIAGSVYLVDSIGYTVLTDYDRYADVFTMIVLLPAIVGEAAFTFWLLRQGRAAAPAVIPQPAAAHA